MPKDEYYLVLENCSGVYDFGEAYFYIGKESFTFKAELSYPESTEIENNDNFNTAQLISGKETPSGVIPYGDRYDAYKIKVEYGGNLKINFEGYTCMFCESGGK